MRNPTRRKAGVLSVLALLASAFAAILASATATPAGAQALQDNACVVSLTGDAFQLPVGLDGTAPDTVEPGSSFTLSDVSLETVLAGEIFVAGVEFGLIQDGDVLDTTWTYTVNGTNTVEGTQTETETVQVQVNVAPDPDTGELVGEDQPVAINFGNQTWTADGVDGDIIDFSQFEADLVAGNSSLEIVIPLGTIIVTIDCSPGTVDDTVEEPDITNVTLIPATPFASSEIGTVPPTAVNDSASVGTLGCVIINVLANDIAGTNPIDPSTVAIGTPPTAGSATPATDGTVTYCHEDELADSDSFTYTVADTELNVSNEATVTISVLGDFCDATTESCDLDQVIQVTVEGDTLTLEQAGEGAPVTLASITLDGTPQTTGGDLHGLTVVNARGDDAGWDLTGVISGDFHDGVGSPNCPITDPSTWHNHCIPGGNLGWTPGAEVLHEQIPGDVAHVDAGDAVAPFEDNLGLQETRTLCSAPANQSGGTFGCGGGVSLAIPASAAAGTYQGTLTLTLA
jgi:hypothetical protein